MRALASMLLLGSLFTTLSSAQEVARAEPPADRVSMIRAYYHSPAELQAIASQFQHIIVDQKSASVKTEAYVADIKALQAAGIAATDAQLYPDYAPDYWATFFTDPDGIRLEITNYRLERRQRHDEWDSPA